jgi:hypothetical protein
MGGFKLESAISNRAASTKKEIGVAFHALQVTGSHNLSLGSY